MTAGRGEMSVYVASRNEALRSATAVARCLNVDELREAVTPEQKSTEEDVCEAHAHNEELAIHWAKGEAAPQLAPRVKSRAPAISEEIRNRIAHGIQSSCRHTCSEVLRGYKDCPEQFDPGIGTRFRKSGTEEGRSN